MVELIAWPAMVNCRTVPASSEPVAVATCLAAVQARFGQGVRMEIAEVVRFDGVDHVNVRGFADSATVNYGWVCKVRNGLLMGDLLILPRKFRP